MMSEYREVLLRPKFRFSASLVNSILELVQSTGLSVVPPTISNIDFPDEEDIAFFEVAQFCNAPLVTGNLKHYPFDPLVITVSDFYETYILR